MNEEERRKKLAIMIADVIQNLLSDSEDLSLLLEEANKEGYDILLTIFSGIMIRRRDEELDDDDEEESPLPLNFELTQADREFLQSIGISFLDE
ncbi:hypothetical protein GF339_16485 [candidate division KSB3 bacterium]|jgi:hypothetical protein|uniref:Uncharacterized protein n=1 Tax=candidate division KSB3 bacterium TaxID=2044937 RepID=A0A9D5JYP9_9BACT|nr:hypothetical protein [candidate division KSB3 bacterium]MBD3326186.1 hypothetical protein [candidate division KSB3 bacterium]